MPKVWYEVWARKPKKGKGKHGRLEFVADYPARRWQFAVKAWARLAARGYREVTVREVTVAHEMVNAGERSGP